MVTPLRLLAISLTVYLVRAITTFDDPAAVTNLSLPTKAPKADDRLDCWLQDDPPAQTACQALGCLWDDSVATAPKCFFPKVGYGYEKIGAQSTTFHGFSVMLNRMNHQSRFGGDVNNLQFQVDYITEDILRFKFYDPSAARYEVPIQKDFDLLNNRRAFNISDAKYHVQYQSDATFGFRFQVKRKSSNTTVWDTSIGGLTFSNQFLQLASYLSSSNIYGIGENAHPSFKHNMSYKSWALLARDTFPLDGPINLYGVHPYYSCLEADGKAHGVLFLNSNAMEYTMMPAPALSVRTIGGVLDFFVFLGDNPENVVQLYTQLVGRPFMPPYWALGFQLCRWGFTSVQDIKTVVDRMKAAEIPQDVQYSDIDYMDENKDFTWDKVGFAGFDTYMTDTKKEGLRWILILDPAVLAVDPNYLPYNEGRDANIFVHWPDDIPLPKRHNPPGVDVEHGFIYGNEWPNGPVVYPDFFRNATRDWWKKSIGYLYDDLKFDGLWIDMNEPSNAQTNTLDSGINGQNKINVFKSINKTRVNDWHLDCPVNPYDDPAYVPMAARIWGKGSRVSINTLCMASVQGDSSQFRHYDVHSMYGLSEIEPTIRAARDLTGERSLTFSRSTYPSAGKHGGHWLGDNDSRWVDLHRSIIGMMEFGLFGIPYIGADICGFNGVTTPEMCHRWMQLGAFYPLSRNHNIIGSPDQDPAALGPEVADASRRALNIRYKLLPYLYTLFFGAHVFGTTVVRPLFHEFPTDPNTFGIDRQFLWGPALLISPVLDMNQTEVNAYLPDDVWYDYHTGLQVPHTGQYITVTDLTDTPLHVRGGYILAAQDPALNTKESRQNPFSLLAYPKNGWAVGDIFWDDGQSQDTIEKSEYILMKFDLSPRTLKIENWSPPSNISERFLLRDIVLFGTEVRRSEAIMNGQTIVPVDINYEQKSSTITVNIWISKDLPPTTIQW